MQAVVVPRVQRCDRVNQQAHNANPTVQPMRANSAPASATASSNPEVTEFQKLVMGATFARRE